MVDPREQLALQILPWPIQTECLKAVLNARIDLDCVTTDGDDREAAVNVHLAYVLAQGYLRPHSHELPGHPSDLRELLLEKMSREQRLLRVWHIGTTCLFVFSLHLATRTRRSRQVDPQTQLVLMAIGQQAYDLAARFERNGRSERCSVANRLADGFPHYATLTRQAGTILGFHERPELLIEPKHSSIILDQVLEAYSRFQSSQSHRDWERLQETIGHYRRYNPNFPMKLPPEPADCV